MKLTLPDRAVFAVPVRIFFRKENYMIIYADNAATTKMSRKAIDAMLPYLDTIYGNPSSLHSAGQEAAEVLFKARSDIAGHIGCTAPEIYFTSGGSEADNQAILSAAAIGSRKGKKHIISSAIEHHAVLHTLNKLRKQGFEITLLSAHEDGLVRPDELEAAIRPGYGAGIHYVRQQRNRYHSAGESDWRNLQTKGRPLSL